MKIDAIVAEIGSTTTVVNAFTNLNSPCPIFLGQGQAPTTVLQGDVTIGLKQAIKSLKEKLNCNELLYDVFYATSSAAGGLKMTVHGLVYDMTVRAAREAALGAGAIIHQVTSGKLRKTDLARIKEIKPNIILLAGGVDYGERDTALHNAEKLAQLDYNVPIIYAGNIENVDEIKEIFKNSPCNVYFVDNVYPKIDQLNIEPTRKVIQKVFEEHITQGPGMEKIREIVDGNIIPTPGAVMLASQLLKDNIGDLMTIDVGGATTDVHSVTEGREEINRILISPEPVAKRTVEGDLGVYINILNVVEIIGLKNLAKQLEIDEEALESTIKKHKPIPINENDIKLVEALTEVAVKTAVNRHGGTLRNLYSIGGKKVIAEGKDLTGIKFIIGTGGALTRLPKNTEILKSITKNRKPFGLLPNEDAKILIDNDYIMASLGVLSLNYKEGALYLLKKSLNIVD